ncbi:tyrosinase family protein [Sphingomonas glacialis]|uniref:Tyrosinase family protein n=1 Tax=Sphingomonas glacialis TaxID=658225 RepID=A0A502G532_9SPHN|nr:tyrosinase family protein [Sphingomonas glacialis]TPG56053.1 tyrosinase family protein [Sphingomonas glacialis]
MSFGKRMRSSILGGSGLPILVFVTLATPAYAQSGALQGSGSLVQPDFSECGNTSVAASDPARGGGTVAVGQTTAGAANTANDLGTKCHTGLGVVPSGVTVAFQSQPGTPQTLESDSAAPALLASERPSVLSLTAAQLASLRRGVAQMKAWNSEPHGSANFRRSWIYWANMHSYFGTGCAAVSGLSAAGMSGLTAQSKSNADEQATWCTCQHGTIQFLTWHRMYLYYFEKVLQAAAGDANLRLPFWDYESNAQMPAAYRDQTYVNSMGQTVANPLYIPNRQPQLNAGTSSLSASVVSTSNAMAQTSYSPFNSALEGTPHGAVHCAVGVANCPTGYMGAVPAAGNDPIFYTHHTNIDRLYECWLRVSPTTRLPTNAAQLATIFNFIDGSGALVQSKVADMLTVAQLGYHYAAGGGCPVTRSAGFTAALERETPVRTIPLLGPTALKRGTTVVPLTTAPQTRSLLLGAVSDGGSAATRLRLVIDGLTYDEAPQVLYEVYLQDSAGKRALLGVINFFNQSAPHMEHDGMAMAAPANETVFDATAALAALGTGATALVLEPSSGVSGGTVAAASQRISARANVRFSAARIEER